MVGWLVGELVVESSPTLRKKRRRLFNQDSYLRCPFVEILAVFLLIFGSYIIMKYRSRNPG